MAVPSLKEIFALLKTGAIIEAQEKIMELRTSALELQEENLALRTKVLGLEHKVKTLESVAGEPCPKCRKLAWVVESSTPDSQFGRLGGIRRIYKCTVCGFTESHLLTPKLA
jgi:hypothetical protein